MEKGQLSAAVAAIKEKGVLSGKRIERSEVGSPGEFDHLTDDELERALIERLAQLGFAPVAISNGSIAKAPGHVSKIKGLGKPITHAPSETMIAMLTLTIVTTVRYAARLRSMSRMIFKNRNLESLLPNRATA